MIGRSSGIVKRCPDKICEIFSANSTRNTITNCIHQLMSLDPPLEKIVKDDLRLLEKDFTSFFESGKLFLNRISSEFEYCCKRESDPLPLLLFVEDHPWISEYEDRMYLRSKMFQFVFYKMFEHFKILHTLCYSDHINFSDIAKYLKMAIKEEQNDFIFLLAEDLGLDPDLIIHGDSEILANINQIAGDGKEKTSSSVPYVSDFLHKMVKCYKKNLFDICISNCEKILIMDENNEDALYYLALSHYSLANKEVEKEINYKRAIEVFTRVLERENGGIWREKKYVINSIMFRSVSQVHLADLQKGNRTISPEEFGMLLEKAEEGFKEIIGLEKDQYDGLKSSSHILLKKIHELRKDV